jgi:sulfur relay (sulfurtransferase) complex TusBCD TusD component (DsrE family)
MKLGIVTSQTDPEAVFNALRLALYSLEQGDRVRIFLSGKGVEIDQIEDASFDVKGHAQKVLDAGGEFLACGTCLKLRNSEGSEICPLSTLKDHYEIVRDSDRVVTFCLPQLWGPRTSSESDWMNRDGVRASLTWRAQEVHRHGPQPYGSNSWALQGCQYPIRTWRAALNPVRDSQMLHGCVATPTFRGMCSGSPSAT